MRSAPRTDRLRRIPWLIVGVVAGALCMQTWPGQTKSAALWEMAKWLGGGLVVGAAIDFWLHRHPPQLSNRVLFWILVAAAMSLALANGNGLSVVALSAAICYALYASLARSRERDETVAAIRGGLASIDRGDGVPLDEGVNALRDKHQIPEDA